MTPKALDQFLVDYVSADSTISVNCRWLQSQLQELAMLRKINPKELKEQNRELRVELFLAKQQIPEFKLDVRG